MFRMAVTKKTAAELREMNKIRVRRSREKLKNDPVKHAQALEKDRSRKKKETMRPKTRAQMEKIRRSGRERSQNLRDRLLQDKIASQPEDFDYKRDKTLEGRKKRKRTMKEKNKTIETLSKRVKELENELEMEKRFENQESAEATSSTMSELKEILTPRSLRKIKGSMSTTGKKHVRKYGLRLRKSTAKPKTNWSNKRKCLFPEGQDRSSDLPEMVPLSEQEATPAQAVYEFAVNNSIEIPDVKKMKLIKSSETGEKKRVPVRFRSETLDLLHSEFLSEYPEFDIAFSSFCRYFPTDTIILPSCEQWGTALCVKCVNARFKAEALQKAGCTNKTADQLCIDMELKPAVPPATSSY